MHRKGRGVICGLFVDDNILDLWCRKTNPTNTVRRIQRDTSSKKQLTLSGMRISDDVVPDFLYRRLRLQFSEGFTEKTP